jgi:iron complex outermembrane recepter protein
MLISRGKLLIGVSSGVLLVTALVVPAQAVSAQTTAAANTETGEIVVTARKRDESLQDVPISISVLSGQALQQQGVVRSSELQFAVPGFVVQNFETRATITLRGVGAQINGGTSSVATHVNGIFQASSAAQLNRLFDVERIEVLKGPQGTLYGRNSTGGALNIETVTPGHELAGNLSAAYGTFDTMRLDAGATIPLGDNWSVRVAGSYAQGEGQFFNRFNGRMVGAEDYLGGRVTLAGEVGSIKAKLFAQYGSEKDNTQTTLITITTATGQPTFGWNQTVLDSPQDSEIDRRSFIAGATFEGPITDTLSWRSITGFIDYDDTSLIDVNPVVSPVRLAISAPQSAKSFSQELQLLLENDRWTGVLGLYYLNDRQGAGRFLTQTPPGAILFNSQTDRDVKAYALFSDVSYKLTDALTINLGARINRDDVRNAFVGKGLIDGAPFDLQGNQDSFTWRAGLDYAISDRAMVYGFASTGFLAGFFQTRTDQGTGLNQPDEIEPERLLAFEAGGKFILPDSLGFLNVAAFYYRYRDMQVSVGALFLRPDGSTDPTRAPFFFTENAGSANLYGAEVQLVDFRVLPFLKFDASAAYLHARFSEYDSVGNDRLPISFAGKRLPRAPDFSSSASATVDNIKIGSVATALARLEYNYRSRNYFSPNNEVRVSQGPLHLLNANVRVEFDKGRFALTGTARNLTNKKFFDFYGGGNFANTGEFRTYEIGLNFRY